MRRRIMEKFWLDEKYQREVEYRTWSIEENKMYSWEEIKNILLKWWFEEMVFEYNRYIPMMYTGLKDINNKKTHEFDLIKYNEEWANGIYIICFGKYWNGLEYENGEMGNGWFVTKISELNKYDEKEKKEAEKYGIFWGEDISDNFEILGNPFENPELIEQC